MNHYTVLLECLGGTYVEQVEADDLVSATVLWLENISQKKVLGKETAKFIRKVKSEFLDYGLTPLNGLFGVWYFGFSFKKSWVTGHFVLSTNPDS